MEFFRYDIELVFSLAWWLAASLPLKMFVSNTRCHTAGVSLKVSSANVTKRHWRRSFELNHYSVQKVHSSWCFYLRAEMISQVISQVSSVTANWTSFSLGLLVQPKKSQTDQSSFQENNPQFQSWFTPKLWTHFSDSGLTFLDFGLGFSGSGLSFSSS